MQISQHFVANEARPLAPGAAARARLANTSGSRLSLAGDAIDGSDVSALQSAPSTRRASPRDEYSVGGIDGGKSARSLAEPRQRSRTGGHRLRQNTRFRLEGAWLRRRGRRMSKRVLPVLAWCDGDGRGSG